ncbi:hypothetical protein [Rhodococcus tibetensis]|uniref:DUF3263 domain-containing protein n=1 Tax=Rhodococcus tibetensis TaxID=2965064 RepID=A0ABT1QJW3_9NOCA|nr:hypothetical protein [Rhodococcus sp. FXJ9.536]MCQ4122497.1 hypothetical protein [Rhodococcus sp. FXJ9.536]
MQTRPAVEPAEVYDAEWIRFWLGRCEWLERTHSLTSDGRWMTVFAIQWAPFGGAGTAELMERFGVGRERFLELVLEALAPRGTDLQRIRAVKSRLRVSLEYAWRRIE